MGLSLQLQGCTVLGKILQIWKIHFSQLCGSHEMPNRFYEVLISLAHVLSVWFIQVAISYTQSPCCQDIGHSTHHSQNKGNDCL
jgi:hypothetical protein